MCFTKECTYLCFHYGAFLGLVIMAAWWFIFQSMNVFILGDRDCFQLQIRCFRIHEKIDTPWQSEAPLLSYPGHRVERRVWHNSLLCLWLLQRTRWWCIRRHFCVSYGYRMIWTVLCVTGSGMPWILYRISLPPCFKISLINCFIKIHCDKTYWCNSIPVQLIIDRNHVHVTICSCATKIFFQRKRPSWNSGFIFLFVRSQITVKSSSRMRNLLTEPCATFWVMGTRHGVMVDDEKLLRWKISTDTVYNMLKTHTKYAHIINGWLTLKDVKRSWNGLVCEHYGRSLYEQTFIREPFIEKHAISTELSNFSWEKHKNKSHRLCRPDCEPSRIPIQILKRLRNEQKG